MGDIIEFTTLPKHKRLFYRLLNNAINFDVKTSGVAIVGLAGVLQDHCDVTILIGVDNKTLVKSDNRQVVEVSTPNILNGEEYNKFWFMQDKDHIMFGRQVPPLLKVPYKKPISKGQLRWEFMDKQLPEDALIAGYEDEPLYIVRKLLNMSMVLGKYVPSEGVAYFSWEGQILREKKFEILCGYDCEWVSTHEDQIPTRAIPGGYCEEDREPIFIARVRHRGCLIPGRLQASQRLCFALYKFQQITERCYEILTSTLGFASVNMFMIPNEDTTLPVYIERRYNFWEHDDNEDDYDEIGDYLSVT